MVHYREFAPQMEVAEAVATWPAVHKTAVQTGVAPDDGPGPQGDAAARERQARDRRFMPPAAARAIHDDPMPGTEPPPPTPGRLADVPAPEQGAETAGAAPVRELGEPAMAGFDEPAPVPRAAPTRPPVS